eukprot:GHVS01040196.1.p1 GENE.GHVS01040196.1~~GHVS01040196.1.p1  ORF type:complete len:159 (+),score=43.02 GHVS01040196.1:51-527(+)
MPKAKKSRKHVYHEAAAVPSAEVKVEDVEREDVEEEGRGGESRGKRKRNAKREAWRRKFDFTNYMMELNAKQQAEETNGKPLTDFEQLITQLNQLQKQQQESRASAKKRPSTIGVSRKNVRSVEFAHFDKVQAFEPFRKDPVAALHQHIKNSVKPPQP